MSVKTDLLTSLLITARGMTACGAVFGTGSRHKPCGGSRGKYNRPRSDGGDRLREPPKNVPIDKLRRVRQIHLVAAALPHATPSDPIQILPVPRSEKPSHCPPRIRRTCRKSLLSQSLPPPPTCRRRPVNRSLPSPNRTIRRPRKRLSGGRRHGGQTGQSRSFKLSSRSRGPSSRTPPPLTRTAARFQKISNGRGSPSISEPGSSDSIRDPDRLCKVSVPASKGWKPGRKVLPIVGNLGGVVVQALEKPTPALPSPPWLRRDTSRGGTTTPAGRPPALRAVMRPAPTRTRRASEAVTAAASRVHRTCHGPCSVLATLGHVPRQFRGRRCRTASM